LIDPAKVKPGVTYLAQAGSYVAGPCSGIGTCTGPDDCYVGASSTALKTAGLACLDGQLLRWSNASAPTGKGESRIYGHWYKDGESDVHLVDNLSSSHVKSAHVYTDVTGYTGRANSGLYYKQISGLYQLDTEFSISEHNQLQDAEHCNWINTHMDETNVCANLGMRLPTNRETTLTTIDSYWDSCNYGGAPVFSGANGVPNHSSGYTWIASATTDNGSFDYGDWTGSSDYNFDQTGSEHYIVCVAR
jgi:hypothetical protein